MIVSFPETAGANPASTFYLILFNTRQLATQPTGKLATCHVWLRDWLRSNAPHLAA
jgi:hypothetical protein